MCCLGILASSQNPEICMLELPVCLNVSINGCKSYFCNRLLTCTVCVHHLLPNDLWNRLQPPPKTLNLNKLTFAVILGHLNIWTCGDCTLFWLQYNGTWLTCLPSTVSAGIHCNSLSENMATLGESYFKHCCSNYSIAARMAEAGATESH